MNAVFSGIDFSFMDFFANIKDIFLSFRVADAVDILLLAALFIITFRFLRGKKAIALIVGIVVCFVALVLSAVFELRVLYSLFSGIFNNAALLIIILFAPEIRDALEKIGSGSIHGIINFTEHKKKKELYYNVVENICSATRVLSSESCGALIVIEKTTRLSDIVDTGIMINADVSSSLLRNIFFNKAPLHDGAVVIVEGRIAAAGCYLPLTRRTDVDVDLGTRHRAAIGMSESSDAIVVVVSEETGAISVAHDCTLIRNLTPEALRRYLLDNLVKNYTQSDRSAGAE
jgi:diadenylate cyclase